MPLSKSKDRERKRKKFQPNSNLNPDDVQPEAVVNVQPDVEMFGGKPRYLTLSNGQVFDRTYQPEANKKLQWVSNVKVINKEKAEKYRLWREGKAGGTDHMTAAKLLMVCQALDKQMPGLQGKENLLDVVRYGCSGPTMASVKASLGG